MKSALYVITVVLVLSGCSAIVDVVNLQPSQEGSDWSIPPEGQRAEFERRGVKIILWQPIPFFRHDLWLGPPIVPMIPLATPKSIDSLVHLSIDMTSSCDSGTTDLTGFRLVALKLGIRYATSATCEDLEEHTTCPTPTAKLSTHWCGYDVSFNATVREIVDSVDALTLVFPPIHMADTSLTPRPLTLTKISQRYYFALWFGDQ